jgi:hypothetical protein
MEGVTAIGPALGGLMERPRVFGSELSATELADEFLDLWEEAHSKKHDHQWLKMRYRRFPIHDEDAVGEALADRREARGWPDQVEEIIMMLWVPYEERKDR